MKRRSFLGFMAGATVAGPQAMEQSVRPMLHGVEIGSSPIYPNPVSAASLKDFKRWLAEFMESREEWMRRERLQMGCPPLDADLATNRSMSLATKIRINLERTLERRWLSQKLQLEEDVEMATRREKSL